MTLLHLIWLLQRLSEDHKKKVFTLRELSSLTGERPAVVGMTLIRAEKKKVVGRVKALWINLMNPPDLSEVAFAMASPSYISFESALYQRGILSQSPRGSLTVATSGRPRRVTTPLGEIHFIHLKRDLLFGYDAGRVAYPEKAWLDLNYIRRRRGEGFPETWYVKTLNRKRLKEFARPFPPFCFRAILR